MTRTNNRALANWPNNAVSVLDFGAAGDGVTDDSAAIQKAVDYIGTQEGGGTIHFPNGSYVVRTAIYTEAFNSNQLKRYGITLSGESTLQTKFLLQNHVGFFEWNQSTTWRSTTSQSASNINFEARDFTVVLEAHKLQDQLPGNQGINYSNGQIFRIIAGGDTGSNTHWANAVFDKVDIQTYETFLTDPPQPYISNFEVTDKTAKTGSYANIGVFLRGVNRPVFMNCNWSLSPYGQDVGKVQYCRPDIRAEDTFKGESRDCSINTSTNIISCANHGFNIGDPIIFQDNGDSVTYELVYPPSYPNVKSIQTLTDNKLAYFVSPINYTKDQFSISNSYACLTETQADAIPDRFYPDGDPNYCPAIDLVRLNFESVGTVNCKVFPALSCIFSYDTYGIASETSAFWGLRFGFRQESTRQAGSEGGLFRDSTLNNDTGAFVYSPGIEPGFTINNCHFNCWTNAVRLINRKVFELSNNIWYNVMFKDEFPEPYQDVLLENCNEGQIRDVTFWWGDRTNRVNVYADENSYDITVRDCKTVAVDGILFKAEDGATGCRGINNKVDPGTVYPVGRIYEGDIATIHHTNAGALARYASGDDAQTINGDGNEVQIIFNDLLYDNFGGGLDGTGALLLPHWQGIKYVRFTASVVTSNNAENIQIYIKSLEGANLYGLTSTITNGDEFGNLVCSTTSSIIPVDTSTLNGTKFGVFVKHAGGSTMSVLRNESTFFSYEVING